MRAVDYIVGEAIVTKRAIADRKLKSYDQRYTFRVDERDAVVQSALQKGCLYEKRTVIALSAFLGAGDVALDIGANIGTVAIPLARAAPKVRVIAFEPFKRNYDLLAHNIKANNATNVDARHCAVGHVSGSATLSSSVTEILGRNKTERRAVPAPDAREEFNFGAIQLGMGGEAVNLIAIDELRLDRVNVMKVDVEGAEPLVFYGARRTIERYKPIISFEANEQTVTADMRSELKLDKRVAQFSVLALCAELGYDRIIETDHQNYLVLPPYAEHAHDQKFTYRSVRRLTNIADVPWQFHLFKLNDPWAAQKSYKRSHGVLARLDSSESM